MSPTKSFIHNHTFPIIHGPRPSPLTIQKPSYSSHQHTPKKRRYQTGCKGNNPVIIYLTSPKIIHTQPRNFMALVQSLTGLSSTKELQPIGHTSLDRNISSSNYTDSFKMLNSSSMDLNRPKFSTCMSDIPLYTPTAMDFFDS